MNIFLAQFNGPARILIFILIALIAHLAVIAVRRINRRVMRLSPRHSLSKVRSISSLGASVLVFLLYFGAVGFILKEFGVSLTAYLASASVMGLAIGFGSQGLVQDVVTGLTLIFSDLVDLGDLVEISGQTGIVQQIGMRFIVLENHLGAQVSIPNRTVTSVIRYPKGYIRCLADITLSGDRALADQMEEKLNLIVASAYEQYPGIYLAPPSTEARVKTVSGKEFLRIKFRIWPGRGAPLETNLKQEIVQTLKDMDSAYADWMVSITYEVEKKQVTF